jgi:hypothetical protein
VGRVNQAFVVHESKNSKAGAASLRRE